MCRSPWPPALLPHPWACLQVAVTPSKFVAVVDGGDVVVITVRPGKCELQTLLPCWHPVRDGMAMQSSDGPTSEIAVCCGSGARGSVRLVRGGMPAQHLSSLELASGPSGLWAFPLPSSSPPASSGTAKPLPETCTILVLSFDMSNATRVLACESLHALQTEPRQLDEESGFRLDTTTLLAAAVNEFLVQVHADGVQAALLHVTAGSCQWSSSQRLTVATADDEGILVFSPRDTCLTMLRPHSRPSTGSDLQVVSEGRAAGEVSCLLLTPTRAFAGVYGQATADVQPSIACYGRNLELLHTTPLGFAGHENSVPEALVGDSTAVFAGLRNGKAALLACSNTGMRLIRIVVAGTLPVKLVAGYGTVLVLSDTVQVACWNSNRLQMVPVTWQPKCLVAHAAGGMRNTFVLEQANSLEIIELQRGLTESVETIASGHPFALVAEIGGTSSLVAVSHARSLTPTLWLLSATSRHGTLAQLDLEPQLLVWHLAALSTSPDTARILVGMTSETGSRVLKVFRATLSSGAPQIVLLKTVEIAQEAMACTSLGAAFGDRLVVFLPGRAMLLSGSRLQRVCEVQTPAKGSPMTSASSLEQPLVACGTSEGFVQLWSHDASSSLSPLRDIYFGGPLSSLAFCSPTLLFAADRSGTVAAYDGSHEWSSVGVGRLPGMLAKLLPAPRGGTMPDAGVMALMVNGGVWQVFVRGCPTQGEAESVLTQLTASEAYCEGPPMFKLAPD